MVRINFVVEGQTEETFVRDVLAPYFGVRGVSCVASCVSTGKKRGIVYKGGMTSFGKAEQDIIRWMKQDRNAFCATMFDLYGLPNNFPGFEKAIEMSSYDRVVFLERNLADKIKYQKFIPYIQLHEFEALLFSDPEVVGMILRGNDVTVRKLKYICPQFNTPEEINNKPESAPSRRLRDACPAYDKASSEPLIAKKIGLDKLRQACPHFSDWVSRLEGLVFTPMS